MTGLFSQRFSTVSMLTLVILASCEGVISLPNQPFSAENVLLYEVELTPEVPYISENYVLPQLETNATLIAVTWSAESYEIEEGIFQYVSPIEDELITFTAVLTSSIESVSMAFPVLIKSQLHVPEASLRPTLRIQLPQGKEEADLFYEDYTSGTASIQHDQHGTYQTSSIAYP